jgi:hypothetical protein
MPLGLGLHALASLAGEDGQWINCRSKTKSMASSSPRGRGQSWSTTTRGEAEADEEGAAAVHRRCFGEGDAGESRRTDGEIEPWLEEVMCGGDGWGK